MDVPMWGGNITGRQLQQSINNLHQQRDILKLPSENLTVPGVVETRQHRLSFEREKQITSNLAFLSATTDDSLKVMAVCVEEHRPDDGVIIRLATNTGDLTAIKAGFDVLAKVLKEAAHRKNLRSEDIRATFQQVVRLDSSRILSRLRSHHAKGSRKVTGKTPILCQLCDVFSDKDLVSRSVPRDSLRMAREMRALFMKLEAIQKLSVEQSRVEGLLGEIVKLAYDFTETVELAKFLRPSTMNPSLKTHLPNAIGKLGRYYSVALELVSAARDETCRIFKNVSVETCQVEIPTPIRSTALKVHAEIKLLFYYELNPSQPRPRVICSSKSACFLCNLFFELHGIFHIPRSHGRLYHAWVLPTWLEIPKDRHSSLRQLVARMKATIDREASKPKTKRLTGYSHPNESVLLPTAYWSPSIFSAQDPSQISTPTINPILPSISEQTPLHLQSANLDPSSASRAPTPECLSSTSSLTETDHSIDDVQPTVDDASPLSALASMSSISISQDDLPYTQLVTLTTPHFHLLIDKLSLTFEFNSVSSGHLDITHLQDEECSANERTRVIQILDIPTDTEMQQSCLGGKNELGFCLEDPKGRAISVKFKWDRTSLRSD
ncbi:hypothetical protein PVAG01_10948 [Phlyctema vagabunda]|uniref:Uncharacterized protein n=1 Tax=Phlyctema vagabunda TaxID=108571 RepID=A0ABR4P3S2_9HELO